MSKLVNPSIAVCSSASFYDEVIKMSYDIESLGLRPVLPKTAEKMKQNKDHNIAAITDWSKSPTGYHGKALLIREHFDEIAESDVVLVANYTKHGKPNYIGPNVLMEMAVAFSLHKPIYVLNECPTDSPFVDEILGLEPTFLAGNLAALNSLKG
jgi:hypothetical protein